MITKIDFIISALVGFLVGVFAIPTLFNLGIHNRLFLIILPLAVPPLWMLGLWLGGFLSRWFAFTTQFSKFVAVGFLNTAIDFGVLNLLSSATGITTGFIIGGINIPGFVIAVFNSYFWNKLWVFRDRQEENIFRDFPKFLVITLVGLFINSGIVILVTTFIHPFLGVEARVWLNIAKAVAASLSLIWNFVGYKFVVFNQATA